MIVTGDIDCTGAGRPGWLAATFPTRVGSSSIGTGRGTGPRASAPFINLRSPRRLATWAGVVVGARGAGACLPGRYQDATGGDRSMVAVWAEASTASTAFIQIQVP